MPSAVGDESLVTVTSFEDSLIFYTAVQKNVKGNRVLHTARDFPSIFAAVFSL